MKSIIHLKYESPLKLVTVKPFYSSSTSQIGSRSSGEIIGVPPVAIALRFNYIFSEMFYRP